MERWKVTFIILSLSVILPTDGVKVGVVPGTETQKYSAGMFWDYYYNVLFYVDRHYYEIVRLNVFTGEDNFISLDRIPTFIIPSKDFDRRFVIGVQTSVEYLFWPYDYYQGYEVDHYNHDSQYDSEDQLTGLDLDSGGYFSQCLIATLDPCTIHALNDARFDAYGRLWTASDPIPDKGLNYPLGQSALYSTDLRKPGKAPVTVELEPLSFGNDLVWTRDYNIFYFVETNKSCVYSYNYDLAKGNICCGKEVFCTYKHGIKGVPDGLTIDSNGDLWIAAPGSGLVLNVNPNTGHLIRTVEIPVSFVIDIEFGGPDLDILFVSTKDMGNPSDTLPGAIYQVEGLGVHGVREQYATMNSDCTPEFLSS